MTMKIDSQRFVALSLGLVLASVVGCKLGSKASSTTSSSPASKTESPEIKTDPNKTNPSTTAPNTMPATPPDIAGKYNVTGANPNGSPYRGTLEIIAHGDVYQFRWNAGTQYDGIGVANGSVVAVAFANGPNGKGCGVVDYEIAGDGGLEGKWGYWGVNEAGSEKAARKGGSGLEGDYDAAGNNPDGKEYKATLKVEPAGKLYRFVWSNNTDGVGIKQGSNVAVGIGGARCGFVAYEIRSDGTLDGIWGGYGSDQTGTEKATKQ
jgi:hypothetical protein